MVRRMSETTAISVSSWRAPAETEGYRLGANHVPAHASGARRIGLCLCAAIGLGCAWPAGALALPAFPGAQGYGAQTPGGRGGRVIEVTTLEDDGPGSLREAVTAQGPRTIVFRVGGTIRLKSHLRITEPFVTIAGQTAPGSGILLRDAGFYIQTHDVVVRFIRSRVGPSMVEEYDTQDSLQISGEDVHDIVVDHCSFSWSIDECVGIRVPAHDVTFSWNIVSEALRQPFTKEQIGKDRSHSMSLILSGGPTRCSLHHNLLALCNSRNPRIQGGRHGFINNVVYGWGWLTGTFSRSPEVNFIANYYKPGPGSKSLKAICEQPGEMGRIFLKGNRSPDHPLDSLPEWDSIVNAPAAEHQAFEPFEMPEVTTTSAEEAYEAVLRGAGAVLPARDPVDRRIVRNVRLSMGEKIDRPDQVGGYPEMISGPAPHDRDHDGMPDDWETAQGFNPLDAADGPADVDGDGYTNLEEFLESLVSEGMTPRPEVRPVSIDRPEGPFAVSCEGRSLPIVRVGGDSRSCYTQAYFEDELRLKVAPEGPGWVASLQPARFQDRLRPAGNGLELHVAEEGVRIFEQEPDGHRLFAFFDAHEPGAPELDDANVIDATRFGVGVGRANATSRLQAALDAAARMPNGVVFVPTGNHEIDTVRVPSHVTLYLAVSSVLYASGRSPEGAMILFDGVEGAELRGPGVIDGRGDEGLPPVAAVKVRNARSIRLKDVVVRNPSGAGLELVNSTEVSIQRAKVMAADKRADAGGLLINGCQSVTCVRSFISSLDTGISIQSSGGDGAAKEVRGVSVIETIVVSDGIGIRVGPSTEQTIRDVLVRDGDFFCGGQGIAAEAGRGAGGITDLVFRDLTVRVKPAGDPSHVEGPFLVANPSGAGIRDVLFDRVRANAFSPSRISGSPESPIEDVKFWGLEITAEGIGNTEPRPLFELRGVRHPQFRFIHVTWPSNKSSRWTEVLKTEETSDLKAPPEEIFEKPSP